MALIYFFGLSLNDKQMNGYVNSKDIIDNFDRRTWIPRYQRDRVMNSRKIFQLKQLFENNEPIRPIMINFIGEIEKHGKEAVLDGEFHIIDGQQRTLALIETKRTDIKIPVELYLNLSMDEEIDLFHQQKRATPLTFGDLAKSTHGLAGDLIRRWLKDKGANYPIRIVANGKQEGINLSLAVPIFHWCYCKIQDGTSRVAPITGRSALTFLATERAEKDLQLADFAMRNVLATYVRLFGEYDFRAVVYIRPWILAVTHVIIDNFLDRSGKVSLGKMEEKLAKSADLLKNAHVKEVLLAGGNQAMHLVYNEIIHFLNHKKRAGNLLPTNRDLYAIQHAHEASA